MTWQQSNELKWCVLHDNDNVQWSCAHCNNDNHNTMTMQWWCEHFNDDNVQWWCDDHMTRQWKEEREEEKEGKKKKKKGVEEEEDKEEVENTDGKTRRRTE